MAFSISYIVEIQDKYSKQLKKIAEITCGFEKALAKTNKQMKKMAELSKKMRSSVGGSAEAIGAAQEKMLKPVKDSSHALLGAGRAADKYREQVRKIPRVNTKVGKSNNKLTSGLERLEKKLATAGYKFNNFGSIAGTVGGTIIAKDVIGTFADFDYTMNSLQAVLDLPLEKMGAFRDVAKELGRTTPFKASEVAESMRLLAMAGLTPTKVLEAIPGTLDLAAASGIGLAKAAETVTDTLAQTQQDTMALTHINDVFAKAMTMSKLTMENLSEAMVPVATTATNLGIPFEQLVTMLGLMAKGGERGSNAGTILRNALVRMAGPSKKARLWYKYLGVDINSFVDKMGKIKNYPKFLSVLSRLNKQGKMTVSVLKDLFEERGFRAVQVLMNFTNKEFMEFEKTLVKVNGTSRKMAKTKLQGLPGVLRELVSVIEAVKIAFVESGIDQTLINMGRRFRDILYSISKVNPFFLKTVGILTGVAMAGAGLITVLGILSASASAFLALFKPLLLTIGTFIGTLTGPIWGAIAAVGAIGVASIYAWRKSERFRNAIYELGRVIADIFSPLTELVRIIFSTDNVVKGAGGTFAWFGMVVIEGLTNTVWALTDALWLLSLPFKFIGNILKTFREKGFKGVFTPVIREVKILVGWMGDLFDKLTKLTGLTDKITGAPTKAFGKTAEMLKMMGSKAINLAKMGMPDIVTPLKRVGAGIEKSLGVGEKPSAEIISERDRVISNMLMGNIKIDVEGPGAVAEAVIKSTAPGNLGFSVGQ